VRSSTQRFGYRLSRLAELLDGPTGLAWLRSIDRRQQSQPWQQIKCGPSHEAVSVHLNRFRQEWTDALRSIAQQCPAAAEQCAALFRIDPLRTDSDAAIASNLAQIRRVVSDPKAARSVVRERDRNSFGERVIAMRRGKGWSLRRLARECAEAARQLGFGVRAPDRYQLMDYERGRSNAHPRTRVVLATALGVAVDVLE
jgi:hypothetical protein